MDPVASLQDDSIKKAAIAAFFIFKIRAAQLPRISII